MAPLLGELRKSLENAIVEAHEVAESAAEAALTALAVARPAPFAAMSQEQRKLRNALREKARQYSGVQLETGLPRLVEEIAYEQWHRMFFARFLSENGLLMHPSGVPMTLEECAELAPEEGEADAWQLAARYAGQMLPGIFRADDPAVQLRFAPEGRDRLERILDGLPAAVFTADDGLGWVYQFWQTKKKKEVNASGRKIGGADLAPVTQLFTEDYMVRFLLENSLGAWWAARHPDSPLLREFTYLRCRDDGTPAAGTFPGWPDRAAEVTVMDPCCGSGHFLVAAFEQLRCMRMEEEGLGEAAAADAVLRDNLFGLEIDPRCTQIAAFTLALAAWKAGGYRPLPLPNVACSGIPVQGQLETWTRLAGNDQKLRTALERLYHLFKDAPTLGSLIDPADVPLRERMFTAGYAQVAPLLQRALAKERASDDPTAEVFGAAAEGVAKAAVLLAGTYTVVVTNVPFLTRSKQADVLKEHCEEHHPETKADLATVFVERCRDFASSGGCCAVVTPQNWLFLNSYKKMRERMLQDSEWNVVVRLGPSAFQDMNWWAATTALLIVSRVRPTRSHCIAGLDVSDPHSPFIKAAQLPCIAVEYANQLDLLGNPDARISLNVGAGETLLGSYASSLQGIASADYPRFGRCFWEVTLPSSRWFLQQSTVELSAPYAGREHVLDWANGKGALAASPQARIQGLAALGKHGVAVSQMRRLPCTLYTGELFDNNTAVILPKNPVYLSAIWACCQSPEYHDAVRRIDPKSSVTNATLVKVPFDLEYWQKVAEEQYPNGLPEPYSNDPTQWLFKGNPVGSTAPLQVAVARLLGYRWPEQEPDRLDRFANSDGIVCLPPLAREQPAAERLRALLAAAYGDGWSVALQERLLAESGAAGKSLETWLRDHFFEQHCRLFHNRPFIWHIWDGRKDGFAALVNYHWLDRARLDKLIYTYLGEWIALRRRDQEAGQAGAEGRLVAALDLKAKLEAIREGEPPYDIYVRWKPLAAQPLGWEPDLNDGVRLNIRPFVIAGVLRSKFTLNWKKDRGTNPDGSERLNDLHCTLAEKRAARQAAGAR